MAVYKRLAAKHSTEFRQITKTIFVDAAYYRDIPIPDLCTAELTTFLKETN